MLQPLLQAHLLYDLRFWLTKIGGIVVIIFGLHMIGVFHIPFLAYDTRVQQAPDPKWGYLSSALMGVFFSAGWSPCVGPVLGAILTLAINGGSISLGAVLSNCLFNWAGYSVSGCRAWHWLGDDHFEEIWQNHALC